jgi:hypothetical protein
MIEKKAYLAGKYFNMAQEMLAYAEKWPDEPIDLIEYREFLDQRWREAKTNLEVRGSLTNREAYSLLRMNTDWTEKYPPPPCAHENKKSV